MKILYKIPEWWVYNIIHLPKLIQNTTPRVNCNINSGLWEIVICQGRFINHNKCTTLMLMMGEAFMGAEDIRGVSVLSSQFCSKPKTSLKTLSLKEKQNETITHTYIHTLKRLKKSYTKMLINSHILQIVGLFFLKFYLYIFFCICIFIKQII